MDLRKILAAGAAILALALAAPAHAEGDGMITMKSEHGVAATLDRLAEVLKANGLTVFARVDHRANAKGADLDLPPTQVLIFGNPKLGTPLMQAGRSVAIDLPQKALAYEDGDGRVWLAYNDPAYLAQRHGITGRTKVRGKIAGALETMMTKAAQGEM